MGASLSGVSRVIAGRAYYSGRAITFRRRFDIADES
jgi:hypothetical protein